VRTPLASSGGRPAVATRRVVAQPRGEAPDGGLVHIPRGESLPSQPPPEHMDGLDTPANDASPVAVLVQASHEGVHVRAQRTYGDLSANLRPDAKGVEHGLLHS